MYCTTPNRIRTIKKGHRATDIRSTTSYCSLSKSKRKNFNLYAPLLPTFTSICEILTSSPSQSPPPPLTLIGRTLSSAHSPQKNKKKTKKAMYVCSTKSPVSNNFGGKEPPCLKSRSTTNANAILPQVRSTVRLVR